VVFLKGGFVGVPVGLAAAFLRIPIITHDSDALQGLANRLVSRWAIIHATALPAKYYSYDIHKIRPVGVLVEHSYKPVDVNLKNEYRNKLNLSPDAMILLVTGGSSGADRINRAMVEIIGELLSKHSNLVVIHQAGKGKVAVYGNYRHDRLKVLEFLNPMYLYMGAADLVVARASGNTIAELGTQGKACIVIPNPDLTGGHQIKNADRLEEQGAAIVVRESVLYDTRNGLLAATVKLLNDGSKRQELAKKLQKLTIPDAAHNVAVLLTETVK
jgi:UDP-N-acetylglucosamine--N-acetylmuramyl-(pentapeptide) pyrophosphoryl-undecaprenol N-acetylglucosamine transferase